VNQKYNEPDADDDAFLEKECAGSDVQEKIHDGIGFLTSAFEPQHREECVADV